SFKIQAGAASTGNTIMGLSRNVYINGAVKGYFAGYLSGSFTGTLDGDMDLNLRRGEYGPEGEYDPEMEYEDESALPEEQENGEAGKMSGEAKEVQDDEA
ncbi:MAG: hypothetical protein IJU93_00285, partial [Lachnospiraceae bacterium]|nr:hypothetical protein [Lachnospiraceae bacterium]